MRAKALAVILVALLALSVTAAAYRGDYTIPGPGHRAGDCDAMSAAFDSLDYQSWHELMSEKTRNGRVMSVVTEETFPVFAQARQAAHSGDHELARELRATLGLHDGIGPQEDAHRHMRQAGHQNR